jgi:hydrogenase/urease accessory protein HupE
VLTTLVVSPRATAHPLNPALLEVHEVPGGKCDVLWRVPVAGPVNAPIHPDLPAAWRTLDPPRSELAGGGQSFSVRWRVTCAGGLTGAQLGVAGLRERRTDALLRVVLADGRTLQTVLRADQPNLIVPARSGAASLVRAYSTLGVRHILSGPDHLLFVLGLLLLVRNRRHLLWTVTAFTVGHSVTLSLAVLRLVRVPRPIEVLIALSILVVAVELARPPEARQLGRQPWRMAFVFGLLHGLGFAGALMQVGLPTHEIPVALFSFNLGIEIGQLLFIGVAAIVRRLYAVRPPLPARYVAGVPAYLIGSLAALWIFERL